MVRRPRHVRRRLGRQRKLIGSYGGTQAGGRSPSASPNPLHTLLQDERRALVLEALGRLPRRDAEILLLKYTEDWSYLELAAHLGVSASAIQARLHRARQRLREAMIGAPTIEVME